MPAKSAKQYKFMAGVASGNIRDVGSDLTKGVAKEFVKKTPKKDRKRYGRKD